jgi:hypothetical protein
MSTRGGEARPATVKIIETVDQSSFKSVVQKFTRRLDGWVRAFINGGASRVSSLLIGSKPKLSSPLHLSSREIPVHHLQPWPSS